MKKHFKKIMALVIAMVMVVGMSMTVFAEGEGDPGSGTGSGEGGTASGYTITMNTSSGHTYTAYQIFSGDLSGSTLSNIQWGDDVDGDGLLGALQEDETYGSAFAECVTARDVAEVLANYTSNGDDIAAIAKIIEDNKSGSGHSGTTSIANLEAGYYLVVDSTAEASMPDGHTYSDFMLEVVKNVQVNAKDTTTTSDKKVKDINDSTAAPETGDNYTDWKDAADYDEGDEIPFKLTATVASDYAKYDTYYLAFHDEESDGLEFDPESVVVYLGATGTTTISSDYYEVVTTGLEDDCTFEIVFEDLTQVSGVTAGSVIRVEYTSTLTSSAVMGSAGNPNTSHVEYSNNPNGEQHGKTADDTVIVFTYKVVVNKVDENEDELEGAGFTLYKKNDQGEYVAVGDELTGDEMTTFTWNRLDDGDYKLSETTTPEGYNTISDIEFTITSVKADGDSPSLTSINGITTTGEITLSGTQTASVTKSSGTIETTIVNESGVELPSTGGMGTTIFYIVGAILVIGAGVILITRRRMRAE